MIVDFHTHAFNPKIADKAVQKLQDVSGLTPYTRGLTAELINRMDEWGVDRSVVLPIATKPSQQTVINDWSAQVAGETDRLIMFGSVHPDADDFEEEINRIASLGLKGIKLHPDYQGFMIDDPRLDGLYECIEKSGLPVVFHAGWDCISPELIHCPPVRSARMLERHPKLKVVLAHLGAHEQWEQVYELLAGREGELYFDTSFTAMCPDGLMMDIIRKHGADRILFGSDCPWESAAKMAEKLLRLNITDDEREMILHKNAERLLGV